MKAYPKFAKSFKYFCNSNTKLLGKFESKLKNVRPFDVTLRDGLQGLSIDEQIKIKQIDKINLFFDIKSKYNPPNMEIGSIVSSKLFPVFKDSDNTYNHIEYLQFLELIESESENEYEYTNNYILIPNEDKFKERNKFLGLDRFSFITSVSESFQMKNTKMSLNESFKQIKNMVQEIDKMEKRKQKKIKVYVSCINECPIEGKIPILNIVSELFLLSTLNINKICLSDTCGTLTNSDFVDIIENSKKLGINTKKFTLHLHIHKDRENEAEKIVHTALDYGIEEFDVSYLKTSVNSLTMDINKITPNMSYEQYYKFLTNYLLK